MSENINLENKSPVIETGRDALFSVDDLKWAMAGKFRRAVMMNNLAKVA